MSVMEQTDEDYESEWQMVTGHRNAIKAGTYASRDIDKIDLNKQNTATENIGIDSR